MIQTRKRGRRFTVSRRFTGNIPSHKAVPKSVLIGQRGINTIERIVDEMGHLWTPTHPASDAGTDGFIELCNHESGATGQIIQVQSKATLGSFKNETETTFEYVCDERDLAHWMEGNAPFVLVVSRPPDEAYWIPIKSYFRDPQVRATRLVCFDKRANAFNRDASESLRHLAVPRSAGIYTQTPAARNETLFSNLLPVARYAQRIYVASTKFRDPMLLFEEMAKHVEHTRGEWILKGECIYSFHNLSMEPWSKICDAATVRDFPSDDWALSHDREVFYDFIWMLGGCLRDHLGRRGVKFYKRKKGVRGYYFFKATKDLAPRVVAWRALQKQTERTVFESYQSKLDPTRIAYYRHLAFLPRFRRFAGQWYLEITPTYHFTKDGVQPDPYGEERLSKIKRIEKNAAVFGNVLFWGRFVSSPDDFFRKGNEFLQFADLIDAAVEFGVSDEDWKSQAEPHEKAELEQEGGTELLLKL